MDGVQRTDLKRMNISDPKVYVHKDGKTIEISANKKDEYMAKGWKLSSMRAEDQSGKEGFEYPEGGKYGYKAERGSGTGAMGTMQVNVTLHNKETDEIMDIKDMHYLELEKGEGQETLEMIWDENKDLIKKEDAEDDRIKKAMKGMVPSTVTGYYEITEFWKEHTLGMGKSDDEVMHEIYEWTWDEMGVSDTKERDEVAKRTLALVNDVIKNNKDDMTFDDMIEQLKGKKEDDTSSKGMNKYGLAAVNKDGKFYSYRNGKLTGTFDNMEDLQKHQHDLIKNEDLAHMAHKVEQDHEVQMARSDLYKAAKYSIKLHERLKNISEEQGLEGWVAAKITKASDYLSSVFHYMDYEMMSSEEMTESRTKIVQAIKAKSEQPQPTYKETINKKYQAKLEEMSKKKTKPVLEDFIDKPISEEEFEKLAEKKDACYHKVRSRYKVWPSAYASGALVQCRKKGAANWGNKSKK